MSKTRLTALFAVFLVAIAAFVAGCGGSDSSSGGATGGDETSAGGGGGEKLTVGSDVPYPPFEDFGATKSEFVGFDVELMEAIGAAIGREVEFKDTSFDTIFTFLAQGKFDVVASAATISAEREETVDFSNPYYLSEQAILIADGGDINSVEGLKGATVGVQKGTTGEEFVEEKGEAGELRSYPSGPDAVNALKAGTVDAVVIDIPVAEHAVEAGGGIELAAAIPTEEEYGLAVAPGEAELLEELNRGLKEVEEDGTYAKIYEKWIHTEPPESITTATHKPS